METDRYPCFPGFMLPHAFFAGLDGSFEPVVCSAEEKKALRHEVCRLVGHPSHEFLTLSEDINLSARLREARRYDADRLFARFEFRRIESNGVWSHPMQLMALFDAQKKMVSYTLLHDRDDVHPDLTYYVVHQQYNWDSYDTTKDPIVALAALDSEAEPEVTISDEKRHIRVYVYGGKGPHKCAFDVEWYLGCDPYIFTVRNVGFETVEAIFDAVANGGMRGLSKLLDWQVFEFAENYRALGFQYDIDAELKRLLLMARLVHAEKIEATVRAVGVGDEPVAEPYFVRVKPGSERQMRSALFNKSLEKDLPPEKVSKLLAYLAIRAHVASMNNLGYHFHFGLGVKEDYDLSEYWHLQGARYGDVDCMLSLGKIYSEKTSPKWDGAKAIEWFEKAVAHGDDWAKGELAHCILCGECIERDFARAESLLVDAVAACPDRDDFAADLERARKGEGL